ncbi:SCO family protein [Methylobacter psychrophilus]|uniref:SCO family protein n=1 Tax=Methylobacter psychrophilus TaxID=96941 RepID=UPI0021D51AE9|nr:SCO family protein [Methylobacter psychrophilus]
MNKREFIKNLTGASLGVAALACIPESFAISVTPVIGNQVSRSKRTFPNVPVVTHEGKVVHFYDDLIKNKIVMINFTYTNCDGICPGMIANLKQVYKEFGARMGKDIFMYSISLQPEHDTPAVLKAFTELHKIKSGWTFLTGSKANIELLREHLGYKNSDPGLDKDNSQHLGVVKFGIESLERWGMAPALGDPKYLAEYIRWMEPNGSRPVLSEMMG